MTGRPSNQFGQATGKSYVPAESHLKYTGPRSGSPVSIHGDRADSHGHRVPIQRARPPFDFSTVRASERGVPGLPQLGARNPYFRLPKRSPGHIALPARPQKAETGKRETDSRRRVTACCPHADRSRSTPPEAACRPLFPRSLPGARNRPEQSMDAAKRERNRMQKEDREHCRTCSGGSAFTLPRRHPTVRRAAHPPAQRAYSPHGRGPRLHPTERAGARPRGSRGVFRSPTPSRCSSPNRT